MKNYLNELLNDLWKYLFLIMKGPYSLYPVYLLPRCVHSLHSVEWLSGLITDKNISLKIFCGKNKKLQLNLILFHLPSIVLYFSWGQICCTFFLRNLIKNTAASDVQFISKSCRKHWLAPPHQDPLLWMILVWGWWGAEQFLYWDQRFSCSVILTPSCSWTLYWQGSR